MRREIAGATVLIILALAIPVTAGLEACTSSTRATTLKTTLASVEAGDAAWHTFDRQHQDELVAEAKDKASALAAVAGWRETQSVVQKLINAAYQALAVAGTANDDPSLAGAVKAAQLLASELKADGVTP